MPLRLRLTVKLSLESPKLSGVCRLIANHLFSSPSKAHQKQGTFPPPELPGIPGNMTLSDSRLNQHTIVLLRVATPYPGRVSHVAQNTFLTCCPPLLRWIGMGSSVASPSCIGLPRILGGSASTTVLSGPSQGSLVLRPARSLQPYGLHFSPKLQQEGLPIPLSG
jgi:hypothetical protein